MQHSRKSNLEYTHSKLHECFIMGGPHNMSKHLFWIWLSFYPIVHMAKCAGVTWPVSHFLKKELDS